MMSEEEALKILMHLIDSLKLTRAEYELLLKAISTIRNPK